MGLLETLQGGASGFRSRDSVTRHLNQLLGSARSFGCLQADYGVAVDALLGGSLAESEERLPVERLRLEILRNLEKFEPGLLSPEVFVRFQDSHGNLHLELRGGLKDGSGLGIWHLRFSTWSREICVWEVP